MKNRYSITIESQLAGGNPSEEKIIDFDMRSLIPVNLRGKNFYLYCEFVSGDFGNDLHSALIVSLELPKNYNKSIPASQYLQLGFALPFINENNNGSDASFSYAFDSSSYIPKMVEYPEVSQIKIFIESLQGANLPNQDFYLTLFFEECDYE